MSPLTACISWRAFPDGRAVTYGDLGRGLGWDGFRVSFGLVKEIVRSGPFSRQARWRELVAGSRALRASGFPGGAG